MEVCIRIFQYGVILLFVIPMAKLEEGYLTRWMAAASLAWVSY